MKVSCTLILVVILVVGNDVAAFQTATRIHTKIDAGTGTTTALTAQPPQPPPSSSRNDFLSSSMRMMGTVVGAAVSANLLPLPPPAAQAMDQYNDKTPTEFWTTGTPTTDKGKPNERTIKARSRDADNLWPNARTQNNSNYAPIKRLTLERKSPVTRLDINAPDFTAYKKSYPGLYNSTSVASTKTTTVAAAAPVAAPIAATVEPVAPPATDAAKPDEPPAAED